MTGSKEKRRYTILVGVDYSELGDIALERACELATAHERTHLHVVHVQPLGHMIGNQLEGTINLSADSTRLHEHVERVVQRWCERQGSPAPFERLTTHVRSESAAEAIAQLASDLEADLVVIGTHGRRGARRFLLGSVAEGTVRLAPCAVLVVRSPHAAIPVIEPPCPRCLAAREVSDGKELWCEQHREHHERRHTYHYLPAPNARQSGFLIHAR